MDYSTLKDEDLIGSYGDLLKELRTRGIIRSQNVLGDFGERLAIAFYNKTPGLPNLQAAPPGTQNVDALSRNGERYSIKATTVKTTGVFYGLPPKDSDEIPNQKFEYVIITLFDKSDYKLIRINELTWNEFLQYKSWHSTMKAWNIPITKKLLDNTKTIYMKER